MSKRSFKRQAPVIVSRYRSALRNIGNTSRPAGLPSMPKPSRIGRAKSVWAAQGKRRKKTITLAPVPSLEKNMEDQ